MPRKRHNNRYSKPQSTPPALLISSSSINRHNDVQPRSVNERLAELRRSDLNRHRNSLPDSAAPTIIQPTVPPSIRQILHLPETPPPRPRRPGRTDPRTGRRLPPGPAPPRSWLTPEGRIRTALPIRPAAETSTAGATGLRCEKGDGLEFRHKVLPDLMLPGRGSLLDVALRKFAQTWEWQREVYGGFLWELPTHLRELMVFYLGVQRAGLETDDLRAVLVPSEERVWEDEDDEEERREIPQAGVLNSEFKRLDLSRSLGNCLKLRELEEFLFPPKPPPTKFTSPTDQQQEPDSWEDALDTPSQTPSPSVPLPVLPNLTHLSLALSPTSSSPVSWRHLLSLASHLPQLTHLSLAFWPVPTLTPLAAQLGASVVNTESGIAVQYGGTGFYSHTLDDDWSEAVHLLRRLSQCLYGLEWLDLTGCGAWWEALFVRVEVAPDEIDAAHQGDGDEGERGTTMVDWCGAWGKVGTVVLDPGWRVEEGKGELRRAGERSRFVELVNKAKKVEKHVRGVRRGQGRWFSVECPAVES